MKILIAPDSFKGSLNALNVAKAIERGIFSVDSSVQSTLLPMADGGEGTMVNLVQATQGDVIKVQSIDPLGRPMMAEYGITGGGKTAIIELATSSGIDLLKIEELNPLIATSFGTGLLIKHALEKGIKHFIICLGGSATNDGGVGLLQALGFRFLDNKGHELLYGGQYLKDIETIDESNVIHAVKDAYFEIACDVKNPFIGEQGASYIFGPQKGATPEMVKQLDQALEHFAHIIQKEKGITIHQLEGAGAAGGVAGGMIGLLNSEIKRGIELVIDFVDLESIVETEQFDYIFTGEGKIDGQTSGGKVISGLSQLAKKHHIPIIALGGSVEKDLSKLYEQGLTAAFSITNGPMNLNNAMANSSYLIESQSEQVFRIIKSKI